MTTCILGSDATISIHKDDNLVQPSLSICVQDVPTGPAVDAKEFGVLEEEQGLAGAGQLIQEVMWIRPG